MANQCEGATNEATSLSSSQHSLRITEAIGRGQEGLKEERREGGEEEEGGYTPSLSSPRQ